MTYRVGRETKVMVRLGNISLSIKLSFLLLLVLGVLLVATILLLYSNTATLTEEIGSERIAQEVNIMKNHLAEVEKQLVVNVNFTASNIPFIQAVGRRSTDTVTGLITTANNSLDMDDIDVVDGDGKVLADLTPGVEDAASDSTLLESALKGNSSTGILVKEVNGQDEISISAVAPVNNIRQGTVLGAIQMSQNIDDEFLRKLAFERDGVYLGLVYNDQIRARTTSSEADSSVILHSNVAFSPDAVKLVASGQTVVLDKLISNGNVPYAVAYIPISSNVNGASPALMVLVELNEIYVFQNSTLVKTIFVFAILAVIALAVIYFSLQTITIQPLNVLKTIAHMTGGQYDQRIPITGQDEVGQLAATFNEMAEAIQQRETSLQAARAQAERSDQVKSAFLASMSHELRTPLNAIINFTRYVAKGSLGEVNAQQVETLNEVVDSGKHLLNLINDVLDMSKIEADSLKLFVEDDIDVKSILQSIVSTGKALMKEKSLEIQTDIQENLPLIRADRQRVLQILLNIISNACKFTEQGHVKVRAYAVADEMIFAIEDTGPGISVEDQISVFQPFKQTTTGLRQGGGTGLGMPISKSLAEAHGGRLWIESEIGKGSTFYCAIPIKSDMLIPSLVA